MDFINEEIVPRGANDIISNISLCSVDFTPTNQLYFGTLAEQTTYFSSKVKRNIPNCRYTARTSKLRINGFVDHINNCNYGYYTNTYQGKSKTYYFWIVAKDYLTRDVTELTIQIDVFQTWLFDMKLNDCYIERGHVDNDEIGSNTIPEDFELGDYVNVSRETITELQGEVCYLIGVTDSDSDLIGTLYGKVYSGFRLRIYRESDTAKLSAYIQDLAKTGKADAIAFIFIFPWQFFADTVAPLTSGAFLGDITKRLNKRISIDKHKKYFSFRDEKYYPKNNKLFTYPYNFMTINNANGSNVVLKYELFNNLDLPTYDFTLEGVLTQNAKFTLTPLEYNGVYESYTDSIESSGFGLCSWNNDNYANWFASNQNTLRAESSNAYASYKANMQVANNNYDTSKANSGINYALGSLNSATQLGVGIGTLNPFAISNGIQSGIGTVASGMQAKNTRENDLANSGLMNTTNYQNTISSINASIQDAKVQPNTCKGDTSYSGLDVSRETNTFFVSQTAIKPEFARVIDMYWQKFGYPIRKLENPKKYLTSRTRWNYIKTLDCVVTGNIPFEDREMIARFFDNGFTVWHDETYLYYYNASNSIR